jgi:DNA-binding transcriptional MocR family regulator
MDEEMARTLAELERKLADLERTLSTIGAASGSAAHASVAPADAQPSSWSVGRIVDETIEPAAPAQAPAPPAPPDLGSRGSRASAAAGWVNTRWDAASRSGARESATGEPAAAPPPSQPAPASSQPTPTATQPAPTSTQPAPTFTQPAPELAQPFAQPAHAPHRSGASTATLDSPALPSAAELLRFRDRLESVLRELAEDCEGLLGRLSYAPVPSVSGSTISFARGAPSLDIVDVEGLSSAAVRAFESDAAGTTAYGTSVGYPRLRAWIAERHGVESDHVLVTNGSMQADAFLFEHLVRPGDDVVVERPSYDRTLLSLRQRGAWVHQVELEPDGIDTDALRRLLGGVAGVRPKLAHIIPNFQNPAGYTLSLAKRRALLELAAEHEFIIFEDDPYVELRFSGERLPTMLSMDPEHVVYASSFSKTVCPGIRVGYLVGPPDLIGAIAQLATNTYISPSMVAQSIVHEFCISGAIDRSIETVKTALAERAEALARALQRELPDADFVPPQGGYFMWVTLPAETDVNALHHAAAERGVSFVRGTDFLLEGGENTLRLAYSGVTPAEIEAGVARLADAYRSL